MLVKHFPIAIFDKPAFFIDEKNNHPVNTLLRLNAISESVHTLYLWHIKTIR
ncbi:hypothetical protein [Elizabethkingia anophelis]|uniref:hypothetical protein n=1 Tax=Elizabethkingia anophelis TaxID=1117645 RepID=UPI0021A27B64